jgi:hypothetical protein
MSIRKIAVALALSLVTITAFAGRELSVPVSIETWPADAYYPGSLPGGTASGDMRSARNSKEKRELIGCGIRAYDDGAGGAFYWGFCQANIESEFPVVDAQCFTYNPGLLTALAGLTDASYITFTWVEVGPDTYECTEIGNSTNSFYLERGKLNEE